MSEIYDIEAKIIIINGTSLLVERSGTIHRYLKNGDLKLIPNTDNSKGYNVIYCNGKTYFRHRIIAYAYLELDIDNPKLVVDHINHDKINNCVDNLRVCSQQLNCFNRIAKGYYYNKPTKKYQSQIRVNEKILYLGLYDNEEDARQSYLNAKAIHHIYNKI
jgi:hypothetical protein